MSDKKKFEYDDFTYDDFTYKDYKESDSVTQAGNALNTHNANKPGEYVQSNAVTNAKNALNTHLTQKPGAYNSPWRSQLNDTINNVKNREFSYDLNGDALYQQYKDKYIQQGKMAMGDAIGQASAMTGGYGNSYAQSVGQQAYQAQLQNLNDIVPELYQMALDKYNMEGQDLYNLYSMLSSEENRSYGEYRDTVSDWNTERDYLSGRYDSERGFDYGVYRDSVSDWNTERDYLAGRYDSERTYDYGKYSDDRNFAYGQYSDDRTLAYDQYSNDKTLAYNEYRNAIADEQWQKEYDLAISKASSTGGSSGGTSGSGSSSGNGNSGGNGSGNNTGGKSPYYTGITQDMRQKAETFTDNLSLEAWAESLEASGAIEHEEALQLVADYMDSNEKYIEQGEGENKTKSISYKDMIGSTKGWSVVSKGGGNLIGIDANAKVQSPNGETIRLDQLKEKLIDEGMSSSAATNAIKKLQQNLGISSNWFFGL